MQKKNCNLDIFKYVRKLTKNTGFNLEEVTMTRKTLVICVGVLLLVVPTIVFGWTSLTTSTHAVDRLDLAPDSMRWDSSATWVFTERYLTIFSYADDNYCEVSNHLGQVQWSDTLTEDDYAFVDLPAEGAYYVRADKGISVMSGNPWEMSTQGSWFAVDERSQPISNRLLSAVSPGVGLPEYERCATIFAYYDGTHVVFRDLAEDEIIWEGDLDSADYYHWDADNAGKDRLVFSVEATYPVSAMSGFASVGMYSPAFNGTFKGRDFFTYAHYAPHEQDIQIVPWEDSVQVTVINLDDPSDTVWEIFLEDEGVSRGLTVNDNGYGPKAFYIHSDKDISVPMIHWESSSHSLGEEIRYFAIRGIDRTGTGLGTDFYVPLQRSDPGIPGNAFSKLHVVAFHDNTDVTVYRIGVEGRNDSLLWDGVLNKGEYYQHITANALYGNATYQVISSKEVAVLGSSGYEKRGSDFFPVQYWETPISVAEESVEVPKLELITSIGPQITLRYSHCPEGFHVSIFDATGRKVDEIHSASSAGLINWGEGHSSGVYFIRFTGDGFETIQKVTVLR